MYEYLTRNVKTSTKYDKYIKKTNCKTYFLGTGTTQKTLELMQDWSYKYAYQTKKLAKQLQGSNLAKTTANIQMFLYNYLQYKADGYKQNLLSPSCAYTLRFKGLDCKSYSIFGGTLLLNKNINFYYKKVMQPSDNNEYSHVYIVVPTNQKTNNLNDGYYVIDGTLPTQQEVIYTKSKTKIMNATMPHYGLNAPQTQNQAQTIINNFVKTLQDLKLGGISNQTIQNLQQTVKYYTDRGINPKFYRAKNTKQGLYVENTYIPFIKQGLNGIGLRGEGEGSDGSGFDFSDLFGDNEDSGGDSNDFNDLFDGITEFFDIDVNQAIDHILSGNFNCINDSNINNDTEIPKIQQGLDGYLDELQQGNLSLQKLSSVYSKANYFLNHVKTHQLFHKSESSSSCSRDKNQAQADYCINLLSQLDQQLTELRERGFTIVINENSRKATPNLYNVNQYTNKRLNHWKGKTRNVDYQEILFTQVPQNNDNSNTNDNNIDTNNNDTNNSNTKSAIIPIAITGLAIKLLLF